MKVKRERAAAEVFRQVYRIRRDKDQPTCARCGKPAKEDAIHHLTEHTCASYCSVECFAAASREPEDPGDE
jgi:hypothetical protein